MLRLSWRTSTEINDVVDQVSKESREMFGPRSFENPLRNSVRNARNELISVA